LILEVEKGVILEGLEILEEAPSISGNPAGIAAAALYLAGRQSDAPFTLSDAGVAAGVTKETVWRKSKEIRLARNSLE
jgi:transcription initiation factor TFIIIB Brf1 subunit/transcription initiation factor TFIIB